MQAVGIATFSSAKPLPGVKDDLKNLRESFGDQVGQVVTGSKITEATLYDVLSRPGLTFICTHGSNVADQPLATPSPAQDLSVSGKPHPANEQGPAADRLPQGGRCRRSPYGHPLA